MTYHAECVERGNQVGRDELSQLHQSLLPSLHQRLLLFATSYSFPYLGCMAPKKDS